jgi:2-(1,2-epoxy-1,2-dihydrophenyl)acetyl-CoA isomerase
VSRAMQLALMGESVGGQEAERWGMANWVVPDAELEKKTADVVGRLASGASIAIREIKRLLQGETREQFAAQLESEARGLAACSASEDFVEAINAFLQKRKPVFHGR